jgi:hypothetical protein
MPKFRVLGERAVIYWTVVDAKDSYEAYDKSDKLTTDKWNLIEEDNTIEPVEVYPNDEEEVEEEFMFDPINVIGADDEA